MARAPSGASVTARSRRRDPRSPPARHRPRGEARQVVLGLAPRDEVGDDPGRPERHGPPHVAVTGVEDEVPVAPHPEDGRAVGGHRTQARAILPPLVVATLGLWTPRARTKVSAVTGPASVTAVMTRSPWATKPVTRVPTRKPTSSFSRQTSASRSVKRRESPLWSVRSRTAPASFC